MDRRTRLSSTPEGLHCKSTQVRFGSACSLSRFFGGAINPLVNAMPERLAILLQEAPMLRALTACFVTEASERPCGRPVALNRLCEVIVLIMLRIAIEFGATGSGLLAGLSHPALHRAIVAMHDTPSRAWTIEELATLAGMLRSRFMANFRKVVGTTPKAYLTSWRLMLARRELLQGGRVKATAAHVGFGSAGGFSRAYSRKFDHPPVTAARRAFSPL